jgi:hypothetical protein
MEINASCKKTVDGLIRPFALVDEEFHKDMERWSMDNCDEFPGSAEDAKKEEAEGMKLVYTELYNKFQEAFEAKLSEFIEKQGSTSEDFAEKVRETQENGDGEEMAFLEMMLMIVDFTTWKQMMREAKAAKLAGKERP